MNCLEKFFEIYHSEASDVSFCPYRVCPLGAHSDHNLGKVTGFAIDKGIHIAYRAKQNGVIELASLNFEKRAQFHVSSTPEASQGDWADYLRGATLALNEKYALRIGMAGVIEGSLPIGGLSSSAAVIIAFLNALCKLNGLKLSAHEMIQMAQEAERKYVGVSCGKLDQSCEVLASRNHLLYLDTLDDSYELIPVNPAMKPFRIAVFFSGVERSLAGSKYNMRVDECQSAAYALLAFAGKDYGKFSETFLRQVPREVFEQYKGRLPEPWRKRAEHWFGEYERVEQGVKAWRDGNLEEYGRLVFASGRSSIELWETGSPELKRLYEIMTETNGIYGGRFSGAGFKGCCMALINPDLADSIAAKVTDDYLKSFPQLAGKFSVHICDTDNGVGNCKA